MNQTSMTTDNQPTLSPIRRLLRLLSPERRDIIIVIAFAIGVGVLTLATPVAVQALVNIVSFGGMTQPLLVLALLLLAFLTLAGTIRAFKAYVVEMLQRRLFVRVVTDLGYRLPRVHVESFDRNHGPELVNRFFDVLTVQKVGATLLLDGVAVVLQTIIGLLILAFYHPFLLAFDVVLVAGIAFVLFVMGRGAIRTAIVESKAKYAVAASLEEIVRNPLSFKQVGGPQLARHRADGLAVSYVEARRLHYRVVFRQIVSSLALQALAATALLTLGGWLVINGQLTLGQLVASELIVSIVLASFAKLGQKLESFYDLLAAVDKLGQLLDLPLERDGGEQLNVSSSGSELRLFDVGFAYSGQRFVLRDFNMAVRPGERIHIVGGHGSGKSTLTELLYGMRVPTAGRIELDGVDLREISLSSLRRQVAIVKGVEMIDGTIEENVSMGRPEVSGADVRAALATIGMLEEVRELPDGMATVLNSSGAPLSSGQALRLMLARAIAGKPRLLVLDDVLDDLDIDARREALRALVHPDHGWTLIIMNRHDDTFEEFQRTVRLSDNGFPSSVRGHLPMQNGEAVSS
ncbi:MAG: ABC transporter ATP-binding protein/permease [Phycisphaerales bacterium]|nr:ABC transporter ATP-binding protein/permease [Phycisphaerales bacterium]